jgi:hypothetical protein
MLDRKPPPPPRQLALFPELEQTEPKAPAARHAAAGEEKSGLQLRRPAPASPPVAAPAPLPAAPLPTPPQPPRRANGEGLLQVLVHNLGDGLASLVLTNNRSRIVSSRAERDGALHLRIHRSFAEAPPEIVAALVAFLKSPRRAKRAEALRAIRDYFDLWRREAEPSRPPRRTRLAARGEFFDLEAMRDEVNRQYFGGRLEVAITWGKNGSALRGRKKRGFSVRLGSYHERENLVRIHPVLDRADVPFYVVESIVHHEMVHAVVPTERGKSRRIVHGPEFRRLEKLYRRHEEAEAWLKANIERLAKQR